MGKRCKYCKEVFIPNVKVGKRQKACSKTKCKKARKRENNKRFRSCNPDYWKDHYTYLKDWRMKHPEYQKNWRKTKKERIKKMSEGEIKAEMVTQVLKKLEDSCEMLGEIKAEIEAPTLVFKGDEPNLIFKSE